MHVSFAGPSVVAALDLSRVLGGCSVLYMLLIICDAVIKFYSVAIQRAGIFGADMASGLLGEQHPAVGYVI